MIKYAFIYICIALIKKTNLKYLFELGYKLWYVSYLNTIIAIITVCKTLHMVRFKKFGAPENF